MNVIDAFERAGSIPRSVCTIGAFDGVHLGHQQLIRAMLNEAKSRAACSVVVTFHPHPREVLGRGEVKYLTTPDEKAEQIRLLGVDILVVLPFTLETSQTPAGHFVDAMVKHLGLASLWIGPDFAMGHKRAGNAEFLTARGAELGFSVNSLPELSLGHHIVSSTRIRQALARGDIRDAGLCLGRPFSVVTDRLNERTLSAEATHALPAPGVYSARVSGQSAEAQILAAQLGRIHLSRPIGLLTQRPVVEFL